jgi:hypothetical protein
MPENHTGPFTLTPAHLTICLTTLINGPYADADTADVAGLAAEAVRYLDYAAPRGGITDPATIATVAALLATTADRLSQLLAALGDWPAAEVDAGRLTDDQHRHRAPDQLTAPSRAAISQAANHAGNLAAALNTAHDLAAAPHADPAFPAA